MDPSANPFATRFVAPGHVPWTGFEEGWLDELVQRFGSLGRRTQIVGPHGSGKSTLLHHLVPKIDESWIEGGAVHWLSLRRDRRMVACLAERLADAKRGDLLVLDGFEQLSRLRRWWVRLVTKRRGCGLLVTSHRPAGLPTLHGTEVTPRMASEIVSNLWRDVTGFIALPTEIARVDLEQLLAFHQGNMRECLMDLYDLVEVERRKIHLGIPDRATAGVRRR